MNEGPVVGVVGADVDPVVAAVEAAGGDARAGAAAAVVDGSDYVVAVGEPALLAVARTEPGVPVLPVAAGRGVRSVPRDAIADAVRALLADEATTESHPLLAVGVADRTRARALTDCMLVSAEPAQISEYAIERDGELVAQFRADGVVIATPAGSTGYARAAGGPVVPPETDATVAVPVAPFSTETDHWVLPQGELRLSVERDETTVQLLADDRTVGPVEPSEPVWIRPAGTVAVAVVPESGSCFGPFRE